MLLLSPWGYEELCSRKTFRLLGEKLSAAGYPCLRFDYPSTGHSSGVGSELDDSSAWRTSVRKALSELLRLTDADSVLVIGQGIGGTLAADLCREEDVAGLVMMAPVSQGRAYLRELAAWTAMTKPTFLVSATDGPQGGLMAGGFVLSAATADEIKSLNLMKGDAPAAVKTLLLERNDHAGDAKLAEYLQAAGVLCDRETFDGYADYVSDPTLSAMPSAAIEKVLNWVVSNFTVQQTSAVSAITFASAFEPVSGVRETLIRFGPERMFFGACSRPVGESPATAVLFLNSGYDHSIGWARMLVDFSRKLASEGYISLRMDLAGIGESRYWPAQRQQVLYSDTQVDDVRAAIDWLKSEHRVQRIILFGRCSGAYLGLLAAALEPEVNAAFLVNPRKLVWDPDLDVDEAIREPIQSLESYSRRVFDRQSLKKLFSAQINLKKASRKFASALTQKLDRKLAPVLGSLSRHHRLKQVLFTRLKDLRKRKIPVCLIYSENDRGLIELTDWFGSDRRGLDRFPNMECHFIPDADHNLTPVAAREELLNQLQRFLGTVGRVAG